MIHPEQLLNKSKSNFKFRMLRQFNELKNDLSNSLSQAGHEGKTGSSPNIAHSFS